MFVRSICAAPSRTPKSRKCHWDQCFGRGAGMRCVYFLPTLISALACYKLSQLLFQPWHVTNYLNSYFSLDTLQTEPLKNVIPPQPRCRMMLWAKAQKENITPAAALVITALIHTQAHTRAYIRTYMHTHAHVCKRI